MEGSAYVKIRWLIKENRRTWFNGVLTSDINYRRDNCIFLFNSLWMEILDYNKVKQTIDIGQRSLSVAKLIHIASSAFGIGV